MAANLEGELKEIQSAIVVQEGAIMAGTDILDINAPPSVLLADSVEYVSRKLAWERKRLDLLKAYETDLIASIAAREALKVDGYPARKLFQITPEVAENLKAKQDAMRAFSDEMVIPPLLADGLEITERV